MHYVPDSAEWLLSRIDLRTELCVRKQLRRLEREADARLVVVWVHGREDVVVYAGDIAAMPHPFPTQESTVPGHEDVTLSNGEREHAVTHQIVIGRRVVKMGIALIAPGITKSAVLFDLVAATAERIEEIVVEAVA